MYTTFALFCVGGRLTWISPSHVTWTSPSHVTWILCNQERVAMTSVPIYNSDTVNYSTEQCCLPFTLSQVAV